MDPIVIVILIVALLVGGGAGFTMGRGAGRTAALEQGRTSGLKAGQASGREEGRREGREEGRREGREEGRKEGREEGLREGAEQGRTEGFAQGKAAGILEAREASEARFQALIDAVERGRRPSGLQPGSVEERLQNALERGWAPREKEREAALREAVGRVSSFLDTQVRAPLAGASDESDAEELRERMARALGALADLDFFIASTRGERQGTELTKLAQQVAREFAGDQDVGVRVSFGQATVRAEVNPNALMDALYLVLHNAARFGGGQTVELTVETDGSSARITVRDRGAGFTEEAFARAFDPFYSTSPEGLGLGLPHARRLIEQMGGGIELRNRPDGGAEVAISVPLT